MKPKLNRSKLDKIARTAGCCLSSIGDVERLAGFVTERDRHDLWFRFSHLFPAPTQVLVDAVMDYCSGIAIQRVNAGEIFLIPTYRKLTS